VAGLALAKGTPMIRTPIMPWSAWACSLILGVSALFHLPGWPR
jgi:hypothetical protein